MKSAKRCVVIGSGVIGSSCAHYLSHAGFEVFVLEKLSKFNSETSSRNSEVIHAGLYYPRDSFKSKMCIHGKK